jgi:cytoskeletal protein RodZ
MKKNILIIFFFLLLVGVILWVVFYRTPQNTSEEITQPTQEQTTNTNNEQTNIINNPSQFTPPTTERILFKTEKGDVSVKNFYKNAYMVNDAGDAVVSVGGDYQISYIQSDKRFHIVVSGDNPEEIIKTAEQKILQDLNVTKQDICKLWVTVHVDRVYNETGTYPETFSLVFCPN